MTAIEVGQLQRSALAVGRGDIPFGQLVALVLDRINNPGPAPEAAQLGPSVEEGRIVQVLIQSLRTAFLSEKVPA